MMKRGDAMSHSSTAMMQAGAAPRGARYGREKASRRHSMLFDTPFIYVYDRHIYQFIAYIASYLPSPARDIHASALANISRDDDGPLHFVISARGRPADDSTSRRRDTAEFFRRDATLYLHRHEPLPSPSASRPRWPRYLSRRMRKYDTRAVSGDFALKRYSI
jgi:hypothetical protein